MQGRWVGQMLAREAGGADTSNPREADGADATDASEGGGWGECFHGGRVGQMLQMLPRETGGADASMGGGGSFGQGASVTCACSVL